MKKFLKVWSVLTIICMTVVVFGGALVTKTGSADGAVIVGLYVMGS